MLPGRVIRVRTCTLSLLRTFASAAAPAATGGIAASVDAAELKRFSAAASQWWAAEGPYAPLCAMNEVRVPLVLHAAALARESGIKLSEDAGDEPALRVVDVGCGGGLLSEALARTGLARGGSRVGCAADAPLALSVLGIDAEQTAVRAASAHAAIDARLTTSRLRYECTTAEELGARGGAGAFDVAVTSEVLEHVREPEPFLRAVAALLRPGGALVLTTMDRTAAAFALAVLGAEYVARLVPPGTHDWAKFVRPDEARAMLAAAGVAEVQRVGLHYNPLSGRWRQGGSTAVNYAIVGVKAMTARGAAS